MVTSISNAISSCLGSFNRQSTATKVALGALAVGAVGLGIYAAVSWMRRDVKAGEVPDVPPKGQEYIKEPTDTKVKENSFARWLDLPHPVLFQVFSKMNIVDLGRCANVCKKWKEMADNPRLWEAIARSQVLGKKVWEENIGDVGDEPEYRMVPFNGMDGEEIPWKEVSKMHKNPSSYREPSNEDVMIKMPEFDFLVPVTINGRPTTINFVIEVFKNARLPIVCRYIPPTILTDYGDVPIEKSYFARHTWTVVNGTREQNPHLKIIKINEKGLGLYRIPKLIEIMIFQFLSYQADIESGYGQDPMIYSTCSEWVLSGGFMPLTIAGGFEKPATGVTGGLNVKKYHGLFEPIGAGGLREF